MKKLIAVTTALGLAATALYAGGPVVVEDTAVEGAAPSSSGWVVPAILLAVIGLAIASGNDDSQGQCW